MDKRWIALGSVAALAAFVYLNNASWLASRGDGHPLLLAHRGVAQSYSHVGVTNDTCTARLIEPPSNPYLENTLASVAASFRAGADIAEIDIHPTTDGRFAVFHDWSLDCRTNGHGVTRAHSLRYLKSLDIGYGYTADGGRTWPFRGKGVGLLPSLDEVLSAFPTRTLLINVKSNDPAEGEALVRFLAKIPASRRSQLWFYGGAEPLHVLHRRLPAIRVAALKGPAPSLRACLLQYAAIGWSGFVPSSCHHTIIAVPSNYAPWLWGWPNRFVARMQAVDSPVFLAGPYNGTSQGLDARGAAALPSGYAGGIWTDDIEATAKLFRRSR